MNGANTLTDGNETAVSENGERQRGGGGVFAADTHVAVKMLFLAMAFITVYRSVVLALSFFDVDDGLLSSSFQDSSVYSAVWNFVSLVASALGCLAFYRKWYRLAVTTVCVMVGEFFADLLIDWMRDGGIRLSKPVNAMSAVSGMALGLCMLAVLAGTMGSKPIRAYFDGLPSSHLGERKSGFWQWPADPSWRWAGMSIFVLLPVVLTSTFWSIWGDDSLDETDADGLRRYGYARIEVEQTGSGEIVFRWDGRSVSCLKLWEGRIDDIWNKQPIWMALSLETNHNCIKPPARYGLLENDCADSARPVKLKKGKIYTVRIGRNCGPEIVPEPAVSIAAREFIAR